MSKNLLSKVLVFLLSLSSFLASAAGGAVSLSSPAQPVITGLENITVTGGAKIVVIRTVKEHSKKTVLITSPTYKFRPSVKKAVAKVYHQVIKTKNKNFGLVFRSEKLSLEYFLCDAHSSCASIPANFKLKILLAFTLFFFLAFIFKDENVSSYYLVGAGFSEAIQLYRCRPPPILILVKVLDIIQFKKK